MTLHFEKRDVTRKATAEEQADLMQRLLEVLSSIDATKEEAKAAASDYRGIISDLHKRELGLRFNLQTSTVTQEIEVHPVADEKTDMMLYFDRNGNEVIELRHELSQKQRDEAAQLRQLEMFGQDASQDIEDLTKAFGNDAASIYGLAADVLESIQPDINSRIDSPAQPLPETGTEIPNGESQDITQPEPNAEVPKTPDYVPTSGNLDDLQRDHDVRNSSPASQQAPVPIEEESQKATDILSDNSDLPDFPNDLDRLSQSDTLPSATVAAKPGKNRAKKVES